MQKNSLRKRIQRKEKWCHKMEKKLAVIVDNNKEVTTEITDTEMCSSACDVAMETCSSQSHDTCGMRHIATKGESSHLSDNITELAHRLLYDDITKKQKQ